MSNKTSLNFDYNKIRQLTDNLKSNLKTKYDKLEQITTDITNSNFIENLNAQNTILQTSIIENYIDQIDELFGNFLLQGDYTINGRLNVNIIETDDIIIRSYNNRSLLDIINNTFSINNISQVNRLIDIITSRNLKLNNQTITNSILLNTEIKNGNATNFNINGGILNNVTLINSDSGNNSSKWSYNGSSRNIYNNDLIYGNVGIGKKNAVYRLDVNGTTHISEELIVDSSANIGNFFYVNKGNTNVGINNSNPSYDLDVSGNTHVTQRLIVDGSANIGNFFYMNKENTNVGINNNNPLYDLDVSGTVRITSSLMVGTNGINIGLIRYGSAVLLGGTVTVLDVNVKSNSLILLTTNIPGGIPGFIYVSSRSLNTSFTITSTSGTDTSTVGWLLING